jgi:hypothetical protein
VLGSLPVTIVNTGKYLTASEEDGVPAYYHLALTYDATEFLFKVFLDGEAGTCSELYPTYARPIQ